MHGEISLESTLGSGTKATFSIPFSKPQFHGGSSALVDLASIPDRFQSELSVSGCASDYERRSTPPQSPRNKSSLANPHRQNHSDSRPRRASGIAAVSDQGPYLADADRKAMNILVVEDK